MSVTQGKVAKMRLVLVRVRAWCVSDFRAFLAFWGKEFSRENVTEMTELQRFW